MAYNSTTWTVDSLTAANLGTDSIPEATFYKSIQAGYSTEGDVDPATSEMFLTLSMPATKQTGPFKVNNRHIWPTSGNLIRGYFIAENWIPNSGVNTTTFKCYRLTPNAGNAVNSAGSYTLLETVLIANADLQADNRGIIINFTEATCSFSAGDIMAISITNSTDVTTGDTSETNVVFAIKEDWSDIVSTNI